MPNYEFKCEDCGNVFCRLLGINNRNQPLTESCEKCGCNKINRNYSAIGIFSDNNCTPNSKTGGEWNELMSKIKPKIPKRYHKNLDAASSRTARRWMG
jgi:putative FmdB family regulatory protein